MDLVVGQAYLCEAWDLPPDLACNGSGPQLGIFRFIGYLDGRQFTSRVIYCGDTQITLNPNERVANWETMPDSRWAPGVMLWRIVPLQPLIPENEESDVEESRAMRVRRPPLEAPAVAETQTAVELAGNEKSQRGPGGDQSPEQAPLPLVKDRTSMNEGDQPRARRRTRIRLWFSH